MDCKFYVATFSENAIEVIKKNNLNIELNDLCISESLDSENRNQLITTMKREIAESEAKEIIIHGPFTEICPASIDHRAIEMGLQRLSEAFDVCQSLGVNRMVVHTGYMPMIYYKEWHLEKSMWFWKEFMKNKPNDFQIYIENVFEDEPYMMKDLIDGLDDKRIGICLDVGHANAMTQSDISVETWLDVLGYRINHFHLHNNDGKTDLHNPMGNGTLDMNGIFEKISQVCHDHVTFTLESSKCEEDIKWLKSRGDRAK